MDKTVENILERSNTLIKDIKEYILSNKNWIFYFINPLVTSESNKPIYDIINEFGDEWEDYIDFNIVNINVPSVCININIDDGTECGISLKRYIYLSNFNDSVNRNMKIYGGKLNEIRIENLKKEIESYKNILTDKEKELNILLNNG